MRRLLNNTLNLFNIIDKETSSFDEKVGDSRDWVLGEIPKLPASVIINDKKFQHQGVQYKTRAYCSAMATTNAINEGNLVKGIDSNYKGEVLGDKMVELGLLNPDVGAYVIDAIKTAKDLGWFTSYYQVNTVEQIKTALYRGYVIVTGTNRISWKDARDGGVDHIGSGSGHAFTITGYDNRKRIKRPTRDNTKKGLYRDYYIGCVVCENSYGEKYGDDGGFWLGYELIEQGILFNTKKAIVV